MDILTFFEDFFTTKTVLYGFVLGIIFFLLGFLFHYFIHQKRIEKLLLENIWKNILPDFIEDADPPELTNFFKENGESVERFADELDRADLFVTNPNVYLRLGLYYFWKRNFERALKYFRKMEDIDLNRGNAKWAIGCALMRIGEYEKAIAYFNESIKANTYVAECYYNIGWALDEIGDYEQAIEAYSKSYALDNNYWNKYNISCSLTKWGKLDKAFETLNGIANYEGVRELAREDPDFDKLRGDKNYCSSFSNLLIPDQK